MRRCGECSRGSSPTNSHAIDPGALEGLEKSGVSLRKKVAAQSRSILEAFGGRLPKDPVVKAEERVTHLSELASAIE